MTKKEIENKNFYDLKNLLESNLKTIAKLVKKTKTIQDYELVKEYYETEIKIAKTKENKQYQLNLLNKYRDLLLENNKGYVFFGFAGY